jgi:AcrR family transcriptional regulator
VNVVRGPVAQTLGSAAQDRAAQKASTRTRIIDAAIDVFSERGYVGATIDEITQRAVTTPTTLYLHFGSKAGLVHHVLARADTHFDRAYRELARIAADPTLADVRAWLHRTMTTWVSVSAVMKGVYEAAAVSTDVRAALTKAQDGQTAALAEALRTTAPALPEPDSVVYASIMLAPLTDYFGRFLRGEPFPRARVVDAMAASWMAVIELCRNRPR